MNVSLRAIDADNWEACIRLQPGEAGSQFIYANVYSIAESKVRPYMLPFGIYDGDIMVGFVMFSKEERDGNYWIHRLMVDEAHQGKGYGGAALREVVRRLSENSDCQTIYLSYSPENLDAERLYLRNGFVKGEIASWGEQTAIYHCGSSNDGM